MLNRELDRAVVTSRGPKNSVDPNRPYAFALEPECDERGQIVDVATLFLVNRECPLRCSMCDLWKNTLDSRIEPGRIPAQIEFVLQQLGPAEVVKLYNSGNFFDPNAIPVSDYDAILELVRPFKTVVVENHPRFLKRSCLEFASRLTGQLEVAIGLETIHEATLASLNKRMTVDDFSRAVETLRSHDIAVRAFVLLKPPGMSEEQGVDWALRSIEFAFDRGVRVCSVIPTRGGNGYLELLANDGIYAPPTMRSMEEILRRGIELRRQRVFIDLWDAQQFSRCDSCVDARVARLHQMNLTQQLAEELTCADCPDDRGDGNR